MSSYIETEKLDQWFENRCNQFSNNDKPLSVMEYAEIQSDINNSLREEEIPTADVVSREQYNELYEENLKLREEINNLAGEELPWAIVTVRTHNKGESPYRYHCPHCGYSHKKPSHYCSNCGRRCKE